MICDLIFAVTLCATLVTEILNAAFEISNMHKNTYFQSIRESAVMEDTL